MTMNKDEAVKKLATIGCISMSYAEDIYDSLFEKPVVPQFVADWYEANKERFDYRLWDYIRNWDYQSSSDFKSWIDNRKNAFQTLVNMHQFGYEVEKEKRYIVKVKGIAEAYNCLNYNTVQKMYAISTTVESGVYIIKFTRKELEKAGFGEVFDNPMFEIGEVE